MTGRSPIRIARRAELPPFEGIRAATLDGLLLALTQRGITQPVFADLSLGGWRSHEVARSIFGQLAITWPLPASPPLQLEDLTNPTEHGSASVIGDWIDGEGRGDAAERAGLFLAEQLFGALDARPLILILLTPRFDLAWPAESAAFLRYLAHGARPGAGSCDRIILVADAGCSTSECMGAAVCWNDAPACPPRTQPPGLAALVPGVVDPETVSALDADGHLLSAGWLLIPPEWRRDPRTTAALDFDRLAAAAVEPWLRAFAHVYGNSYFVDPWFLCAEATRQLADGGHGIALQLMERAAACAQSASDRASIRALLQGFQIALMHYDEVADAPDPSPALSPLLRGALLMTKGWGLVMARQAQRAEPYMQSARELLTPILGRNRQFLYLMNISALNRVNLGDMDGALAIEKEIEAASAAADNIDHSLDYVNSINLARLYRRRNDFDLSATYYARAFATTEGARTESDLVYTNACMARLDSARGRHRNAFLGWLRAALHWLSSDVPEALGWRVLSAVCGTKVKHGERVPLEQVARSLYELLRVSAEAAGITLPSEMAASSPPAFLRANRMKPLTMEAIGADGFSVLLTTAPAQPGQSGPQYKALAALVAGLLADLAQAPELEQGPTILIDDGLGREMPTTKHELLAACLRLGVKRARYNGDAMELTPERAAALLEYARVAVGPAVAHVELSSGGGCVQFKRYLPPRCLSAVEADLLAHCERPTEEALATIRTLEADRVVALRLDVG